MRERERGGKGMGKKRIRSVMKAMIFIVAPQEGQVKGSSS